MSSGRRGRFVFKEDFMRARTRWHLAAWALIGILAAALPAAAQAPTGTISGTVVDESRQVIPGATVLLVHEQTQAVRTTTSSGTGAFVFNAVPPGTYTVRVELAGFRTYEQRGNVLNAASQLTLGNVVLGVGALTEVVTVEAAGTQVETTNSDYTGLLTTKQIAQIQTRGRDVMSLLSLLPGVRIEAEIEAMGDSFGSLVPNVGGHRRHWNAVMVDGLLGNETSGTARFSSALNLDAIEEVKVLLNTYKAEYGRSGGANVQIVSKGGGADYHGSLYYYGRRDKWNANRWENNRQGLPKPKLHIDTYGFNLGGPVVIPGLFKQETDKRLFFFYSLEAPQVQRPGQLRKYLTPTERERRGDFSQTLDSNGRLIVIRDPATGQPFPGNIIPANRIDSNGQAILNYLPVPNTNDPTGVGQFNFLRQETSDNPRWNHFARMDWKRSGDSSYFATVRTFNSDQRGSEITAGPAKWGWFDGTYVFSDSSITTGWTRVFGPNVVNEMSGGVKRQTEGFGTRTDADLERLTRAAAGYRLGQLYPALNTFDALPRALFGLAIPAASIDSPDFTYDNRLGNTAFDYVGSVRDTLTWVTGNHTLKAGGYFEYMQNREARGGNWMGEFTFTRNTNNPLDTNHAFSNALLGVFNQYTETDVYRETFNRGLMSEWFLQDTWRTNDRLTLDYGARFLWYSPWWRPDGRSANFRPELYNPAQAPRLYQPAIVNGQRVAFDPVTGQSLNAVYIGAFVPGTGNPANGMELGTDPDVPKSFRDRNPPQIEPRVGLAYDVFGTGNTSIHASAGLFHQARLGGGQLGNIAGNPPFINNPIINFGTMGGLLAPGTTILNRPANVNAFERSSKTPSAYNWSLGVQQDVGWGTVVDVTYAGSVGRHLEMEVNINAVPDGARFLDRNPQNRDPTNNAALPAEFLRPYRGYQDIFVRGNWGNSDYHSLMVQANRRYIRGVQFGAAYTWSQARGLGEEDPARVSILRPLREWHYADLSFSQRHRLVINYTWDLPDTGWNNVIARTLVDGWQISGSNAFVTGDWASVTLTTTDNFDFTGGDGGNGVGLGGASGPPNGSGDQLRTVRPDMIANPTPGDRDPFTGWFNTAAFKRPSGRGDYGDAPRNPIQRPGINNWNLAAFKNFSVGGSRVLQFRAELYNVLNTTQISDIDRNARFDPAGNMVNPNFGRATISNPPRLIQLALRFTF
jgi:hypothetical protein